MKKIKVAVIYGGQSGEHEISCISGAAVLQNLDRNLFEPIPIGIDKQGRWLVDQEPNVLLPGAQTLQINQQTAEELPFVQPSSSALKQFVKSEKLFDVVFPIVHGVLAEDGTLQGLFELLNVPYVGCGILSSALGMHKDISKKLVAAAGIPVVPSIMIPGGQWQHNKENIREQIVQKFTFPLFIKPCNTGSSVGIEKIYDESQLNKAIENALSYDHHVVVEPALNIRDVEMAVLENRHYGEAPQVSTVGEIIISSKHDFYSYTAKYLDPEALTLKIPADLPAELIEKLQKIAQEIFVILECEGMARVDLFLEKETQHIYFNEINTIPGFTPYSMYPKLWSATGLQYQDLLTELVFLAMARHERKEKLKRDWK